MAQRFGGEWTQKKLARVGKYLHAYSQIFTSNERARFFRTWYVDAFAGSGTREQVRAASESDDPAEAVELLKGSVHVALESEPPFDRYVFIEKDAAYASNLEKIREEYPSRAERIEVVNADGNEFLRRWCRETDWRKNRAVVFLDPYGMQVDWSTIEAIGATKAIDLWILFPLGQGVNRLLIRDKPPEGGWAERLTRFFGSTEWRERFYRPRRQASLSVMRRNLKKKRTSTPSALISWSGCGLHSRPSRPSRSRFATRRVCRFSCFASRLQTRRVLPRPYELRMTF